MTVLASTRTDVAGFLDAVLFVYTILIIVYVLVTMIFSLRGRAGVAYSSLGEAVLNFLRDVSEPYLRIFRSFVPMIGPIDISPILAILVLQLVGGLLVRAIHG